MVTLLNICSRDIDSYDNPVLTLGVLKKETESRKEVELQLNRVKNDLNMTKSNRPTRIQDLKSEIDKVKADKSHYQSQLNQIRTELKRLQQAYHQGILTSYSLLYIYTYL